MWRYVESKNNIKIVHERQFKDEIKSLYKKEKKTFMGFEPSIVKRQRARNTMYNHYRRFGLQ